MEFNLEFFKKSADFIKSEINGFEPEIGLVLGTGLGHFAGRLDIRYEISYKDIPNFLVSTAPGHAGKLIFAECCGKKLVCMAGRFHFYEGYTMAELSIPVRVLGLLGIKKLVLTNAAGAINENYCVGDVMVMTDHIKFTNGSPMIGPNVPEFGDRFFDVSNMYDAAMRRVALDCAKGSGLNVHEGVYFYFTGPQFETPAEIRAARILGGDAAGMSTVTEALTAAHMGIPVLGISVMTNMAAGVHGKAVAHNEVESVSDRIAPMMEDYMLKIIERI